MPPAVRVRCFPHLTIVTPDPGDDYFASLARAAGADYLVSGDAQLTGLEDAEPPVLTPRAFDELFGPVD